MLLTNEGLINLKYLYPCTGQGPSVTSKSINMRPIDDNWCVGCHWLPNWHVHVQYNKYSLFPTEHNWV